MAKAIAATKNTRRVPQEQVPAELRGLYKDDVAAEEASLDFTTEATDNEPEVETEKLFSVDGKEYRIPVRFGPGVGLIYLDLIDQGRDVALGAILKSVIGKDGWSALMQLARDNRISVAQFKGIITKVQERTMGAVEELEGN